MDAQTPPRDASLRNIIDKLAEFVARNGPEFELITKQKQQGNPKFEFLYGGEYANYYQHRVAAEQAYLKQQNTLTTNAPPPVHMQQQPPPQQQQLSHFSQAPPPMLIHQQPSQQQQQQPQQTQSNVHDNASFNMNQPPPQHNQMLWATAAAAVNQVQQSNGNSMAINLKSQIDSINLQQSTLHEQIHQSKSNLSAQHTALMALQTKQIDEAIQGAQNAQLEQLADEQSISLKDFDAILQPIIESCTKDSISAGKNWILQHSSDSAKNNVVLQYLLKKALVNGSSFQPKLHLIYLVNDILHHCMRKNVNDLKNSLENVVIPMFCSADLIATNEQRAKLTKLLSLWESKAKFFDACVISKLQSPDSSMQEYKTNLQNMHHDIVSKFTQGTKTTLDNYHKQHQIFIEHATQQIAQLEQQKQQLEQQMLASVMPMSQQQQQPLSQQQQQQQLSQQQQSSPLKSIPSLMSQKVSMPGVESTEQLNPPGVDDNNGNKTIYQPQPSNNIFGGQFQQQTQQQAQQQQPQQQQQQMNRAAAQAQSNFFIPDLSKPPPGFGAMANTQPAASMLMPQYAQINNISPVGTINSINDETGATPVVDMLALNAAIQLVQQQKQQQMQLQQQQHLQLQQQQLHNQQQLPAHVIDNGEEIPPPAPPMTEEEQIPSTPYYDLPAGLMVPLIRLEDFNYKSLDPSDIRLPPPAPQNERLTNALTAFYAPPTHDRPRDNEGWEKLGLYEYYKVKNGAKKQKDEDIQNGIREKSRSPSPIIVEKPKLKKINKRCYRSKSRSRSRTHSPYRSRSRSRSPLPPPRNRSDSRSVGSNSGNGNNSGRNNRYNQRNRHERDSSGSSRSENRAERNARRVERDRSLTPPSFFGNSFAKTNEFIEESNKGHQMLMKMGWAGSGTGLGTKNQGIDQPISAGEVRDRKDMYKGVGNNLNDPFESFRKNKGAAFVHRMRTRDDKS